MKRCYFYEAQRVMIPREVVDNYGRTIPFDGKPEYFRLHKYRFRALLAVLAREPTRDVLEIGATPGQFTTMLVQSGYHVRAIDLFPEQRAALWRALGVEIQFCNLDEQSLPYPDASFDSIVFSEVIEHLAGSPLPSMVEMARVLRPGGRLIITTPNQHYLKSRLRTLTDIMIGRPFESFESFQRSMFLHGPQRYYNHNRLYTMQEICWLFHQAGFEVTLARYVDAWERVGIEAQRIVRHPLRVLAKVSLVGLGLCLPNARSMLLVVGHKPAKNSDT